jgi:hypothetical protein
MTHVLPAINQTMKKDVLSQASRLTASWVNGGYLRSKRADALPNIDPYSGRLLGDTELADAAVVDRAVEAGLRALKGPWPIYKRMVARRCCVTSPMRWNRNV